jgi:F0F1-type ATP synthase membrane subunit c/vacuolar-type H+-ATPase subunit K
VKRKILIISALLATTALLAVPALAENGDDAAVADNGTQMWVFIASAFGMALVSSSGAIAMSISVKSFCEGVSRNPSTADKLQFGLILTLVLIETLALYVFAIIFLKVG